MTRNSLAFNSIVVTAASLFARVTNLLFAAFAARVVPVSELGSYFAATSILSIFLVAADLGLARVIAREVARRPSAADTYAKSLAPTVAAFGFVLMCGAIILSMTVARDECARMVLAWGGVSLIPGALCAFWLSFAWGRERLAYNAVTDAAGSAMILLAGAAAVYLSRKMATVAYVLLGVAVLRGVLSFYFVHRKLRIKSVPWRNDWSIVRSALAMSWPFMIFSLAVTVHARAEIVLVSWLAGSYHAGLYATAHQLSYSVLRLREGFLISLFPVLSREGAAEKSVFLEHLRSTMVWLTLLFVPAAGGVGLVCNKLLVLVYGRPYGDAEHVLRLLVWLWPASALTATCLRGLAAVDRQVSLLCVVVVTMCLSLTCNVIAIPKLGIFGAATTAVATQVLCGMLAASCLWSTLRDARFITTAASLEAGLLCCAGAAGVYRDSMLAAAALTMFGLCILLLVLWREVALRKHKRIIANCLTRNGAKVRVRESKSVEES